MMRGSEALEWATTLALGILLVALLLVLVRLLRGPTLPDRILALDLLTTLAMGFIATIAVRTAFHLYLDLAITIGLLGFLSTIALARYVLRREGNQAQARAAEEAGR